MTTSTVVSDTFINYLIGGHLTVQVFLDNGVKLTGTLSNYDGKAVVLTRDGMSQLVYIDSVATVYPTLPIYLDEVFGE